MNCEEPGSGRLETPQVPQCSFLLLSSFSNSGVPFDLKAYGNTFPYGWLQLTCLARRQREHMKYQSL
jgi:hypothetical protein